MVRISKKNRDRSVSPRRPQPEQKKTGAVRDNLPKGYKEHENALEGEKQAGCFVGLVKRIHSAS